jgi:hypothetical protein
VSVSGASVPGWLGRSLAGSEIILGVLLGANQSGGMVVLAMCEIETGEEL